MKYLKTFENYYHDVLNYYIKKSEVEKEKDGGDDNDENLPDDLLDDDEIEVNDVTKPLKYDVNNSINIFNNLM